MVDKQEKACCVKHLYFCYPLVFVGSKECLLFSGRDLVRREESDAQDAGCAEEMEVPLHGESALQLEEVIAKIETRIRGPKMIMWVSQWSASAPPPTTSWE